MGPSFSSKQSSHQTKPNNKKPTSTGFKQQRIHPACPSKEQNHLQNSLLRRTQFWVRKTFSKPASLKRASLVAFFTYEPISDAWKSTRERKLRALLQLCPVSFSVSFRVTIYRVVTFYSLLALNSEFQCICSFCMMTRCNDHRVCSKFHGELVGIVGCFMGANQL